jgi:hypothetical protein
MPWDDDENDNSSEGSPHFPEGLSQCHAPSPSVVVDDAATLTSPASSSVYPPVPIPSEPLGKRLKKCPPILVQPEQAIPANQNDTLTHMRTSLSKKKIYPRTPIGMQAMSMQQKQQTQQQMPVCESVSSTKAAVFAVRTESAKALQKACKDYDAINLKLQDVVQQAAVRELAHKQIVADLERRLQETQKLLDNKTQTLISFALPNSSSSSSQSGVTSSSIIQWFQRGLPALHAMQRHLEGLPKLALECDGGSDESLSNALIPSSASSFSSSSASASSSSSSACSSTSSTSSSTPSAFPLVQVFNVNYSGFVAFSEFRFLQRESPTPNEILTKGHDWILSHNLEQIYCVAWDADGRPSRLKFASAVGFGGHQLKQLIMFTNYCQLKRKSI